MVDFAPGELPDDPLERRAEAAERAKILAVRRDGREAAIERGRLLGEDTARQQREVNADGSLSVEGDLRVKRAMLYAAWEHDGKPDGEGEKYRAEFGLPERAVTAAADRAVSVRLIQK